MKQTLNILLTALLIMPLAALHAAISTRGHPKMLVFSKILVQKTGLSYSRTPVWPFHLPQVNVYVEQAQWHVGAVAFAVPPIVLASPTCRADAAQNTPIPVLADSRQNSRGGR